MCTIIQEVALIYLPRTAGHHWHIAVKVPVSSSVIVPVQSDEDNETYIEIMVTVMSRHVSNITFSFQIHCTCTCIFTIDYTIKFNCNTHINTSF